MAFAAMRFYRRLIPLRSDLLYFPAVPSSRFTRLIAVAALFTSRLARLIAAPSRLLSVRGEVLRRVVELFLFAIQNKYICLN